MSAHFSDFLIPSLPCQQFFNSVCQQISMKFYLSPPPPHQLQIADVFYERPQRYDRFVGPFEISGKHDLGSGVSFNGVKNRLV